MTPDETFEPRITEEVNPFGKLRYRLQWVRRDGRYPEPYDWTFKSRRKAERFAAKRQKELLDSAYRSVAS